MTTHEFQVTVPESKTQMSKHVHSIGHSLLKIDEEHKSITLQKFDDSSRPELPLVFFTTIDDFSEIKPNMLDQTITFRFDQNTYWVVKFDDQSTSAFHNALGTIYTLQDRQLMKQFYPSGNLRYYGEYVNNKPDGYVQEFYDLPNNPLKYDGEFEKGKYDGKGTFYSPSQSIILSIPNIHKGEPNGICTITLKLKSCTKSEQFKFSQIQEVKLTDSELCSKVADQLFFHAKEMQFLDLDQPMQLIVLMKKLENQQQQLQRMEEKLDQIATNTHPQTLWSYFWKFMGW